MTTLTKAAFFKTTEIVVQLVKDVPGFGDVYLRGSSEVQRIKRSGSMFLANGNRNPENYKRRRLFDIIDQVCTDDKGTPMFTDDDLPQLDEINSSKLDPLYMALNAFNGDDEKKDADESSGSSDS